MLQKITDNQKRPTPAQMGRGTYMRLIKQTDTIPASAVVHATLAVKENIPPATNYLLML